MKILASDAGRIALISDIHGNYPALRAVLADAEKRGAEGYILLGDHIVDFPWPNEVVDALQSLPGLCAIRGNREDLFTRLANNPALQNAEQFAASYWNTGVLHPDNRAYLDALPEKAQLRLHDTDIFAQHIPSRLLGAKTADLLDGEHYTVATHEEFLAYAKAKMLADESRKKLPRGIYLFGHTHAQWHLFDEGCLFINPGSCGLALDDDNRAAYTLLEYENGWQVREMRVAYDIEACIQALRNSAMYGHGKIYNEITALQLRDAKDYLLQFLHYMGKKYPEHDIYPNEIWNDEGEKWLHEHNA